LRPIGRRCMARRYRGALIAAAGPVPAGLRCSGELAAAPDLVATSMALGPFAIGPHFIRPKPVGPNLDRGQSIGRGDLIPRLDSRMIQNGSRCLSGAIFPNRKVHHDGLRGRFHRLDSNHPALLCQFFRHPANMPRRAGQSTGYPQPKPKWPRRDSG
jgi:hypothetical protein